ncbi:MAG: pyridoxal phosphate-dependent aminotransferase family protein [Candidatus Marinimicrobia bacterium]|nr:pyridoxal phosphate-dependent aminotransferase family protein [Candidatus Neomarinimicrobiota bacterium]
MKKNVPVLRAVDPTHVEFEGDTYLFFGGYDYHRLSWHPEIMDTMNRAARKYGINSGGSRCTTGNHPLHIDLERTLSRFFNLEDALLLPTGYLANIALFQGLRKHFDIVFIDEKSHPCIRNGTYVAGMETLVYPHMDGDFIEKQVQKLPRNKKRFLIVTEGTGSVYSPIVPADQYARIAEKYNGMLLVDEAHTAGILGQTGRGIREHFKICADRYLISGTLSKAFGTYGGFIAGGKKWIETIRCTAHAYQGSSAFPLPLCAAGIKAIDIIDRSPEKVHVLQQTSLKVKKYLAEKGFSLPLTPTPTIPVLYDTPAQTEKLKKILKQAGIYPTYIFYPGGPKAGYFRFALSSAHSEEDIKTFLECIDQSL